MIKDNDLKDWQDYISGNIKIDHQIKDQTNDIEKAEIDLHGLTSDQAFALISKTIAMCKKENITTLKIITGLGHNNQGTLYNSLSKWINEIDKNLNCKELYTNKKPIGAFAIKI